MSRPTILFIDWFKTLSWSVFWAEWEESETPEQQRLYRAKNLFFDNEVDRFRAWMRGTETTEAICKDLATRADVPLDFVVSEMRRTCEEMTLPAGAREEIARIRSLGVPVLLITDNMEPFSRWTVPALKLEDVFTEVLSSERTRLLKNDRGADGKPALFRETLHRYGMGWKDAWLIDDSADRYRDMEPEGFRLFVPQSPEDTVGFLRSIN